MYCKNCGKELPDNARFCDRCNMSVRKKEGKLEAIEELKEERLARNKAKAIEARFKKIQKVKRRRRNLVIGFVVFVILAGAVSVLSSYIFTRNSPTTLTKVEEYRQTQAPGSVKDQDSNDDKEVNSDGYISRTEYGVEFAYPRSFAESGVTGKTFKDTNGDGSITIEKKTAESGAVELMEEYRNNIKNAKVKDSLASASGYSITLTADDIVYHKKAAIADGAEVSYEMTYPTSSVHTQEYEKYIEYMDEHFKVSK